MLPPPAAALRRYRPFDGIGASCVPARYDATYTPFFYRVVYVVEITYLYIYLFKMHQHRI